jgi:thiamine kinase-like enzyme
VARFSSAKSALLAIDRAAEYRNAQTAAEVGIGPRVADYSPTDSVLLVEWIEGRTFTESDLDDEPTLARVAAACRQLHSGPRFANDFDMFDVQLSYLQIVREHGFRLPPDYLEFMPQIDRLREVLGTPDADRVPCHNDLLAANIMDDGDRLWLIDYEYSGNNDACFELGNIWSEADLGPDRLDQLVAAYYGRPRPERVARARLFAVLAKYGWTLWASIQSSVSEVDFDFWSWGMDKYARAVAEFRGADFDRWITVVLEPI